MSEKKKHFADFQIDVYLGALGGEIPELPFGYEDLKERAREAMEPGAFDYVAGGAGNEESRHANRQAYEGWGIIPRMLRDVSDRDLSRELFGRHLPVPALLAPIGVQGVVHPDGELAVARATARVGMPMILSTVSSQPLEAVSEALGDTGKWFQLYYPKDRELALSFVDRAGRAGYEALVVNLDTALLGWRERDLRRAYLPFLKGQGLANYLSDPVFRDSLAEPPEANPQAAVQRFVEVFGNPGLGWEDLDFLRERTEMPILLKGILHPDDAREARERGMDGVIVSNHGGRQVDGAVAALDALSGVVDAVGPDFPVLFDSGIRTGSDAFKALALGARSVLLGRPYVWGLGVAGDEGVEHVLRSFLADLDLTLALSGYTSFDQIDRSCLMRRA